MQQCCRAGHCRPGLEHGLEQPLVLYALLATLLAPAQEAGLPWKEPLRFALPDFSNIDLSNIDLTKGVNAVVSRVSACGRCLVPGMCRRVPAASA